MVRTSPSPSHSYSASMILYMIDKGYSVTVCGCNSGIYENLKLNFKKKDVNSKLLIERESYAGLVCHETSFMETEVSKFENVRVL